MIIIERIKELIARKEMSETSFAKLIGVSQRTLNNYMNGRTPSLEVLDAILSAFPEVSAEWLLRGEGDMLKNSGTMTGSNQGDGNKIEYKNGGNVGVGNTVNVTLPELGTQKIIKPDGTVELTSIGSNGDASDKLQMENETLKEKISHLMDNMQLKDDLIASLRDTIELLKHRQ